MKKIYCILFVGSLMCWGNRGSVQTFEDYK